MKNEKIVAFLSAILVNKYMQLAIGLNALGYIYCKGCILLVTCIAFSLTVLTNCFIY